MNVDELISKLKLMIKEEKIKGADNVVFLSSEYSSRVINITVPRVIMKDAIPEMGFIGFEEAK